MTIHLDKLDSQTQAIVNAAFPSVRRFQERVKEETRKADVGKWEWEIFEMSADEVVAERECAVIDKYAAAFRETFAELTKGKKLEPR